jgi:hypothetical protein
MDDAKFDRLAQALSRSLTRRRAMTIAGAVAGMISQRATRAFQLVPATCGEEGAVCTLTVGCCDGLTCVTSVINTSYGVCVPGGGGMVSSGTTLISPFSEVAVDEATALLEDASTGSATDFLADREARIADARARRDANRAARRARLDSRRSKKHTPDVTARYGPRLKLKLTSSIREEGKQVDTVEATNRGDTNLVLTRIASLLAPEDGTPLTTDPSKFTLTPGESYYFVAGVMTGATSTNDRLHWTTKAACDGSPGAGYLVKAALSVDSRNKDFKVYCKKALGAAAVETAAETPRRNRKRIGQQQKQKR